MLNYSIHQENLDKNFDCIVIITSMAILRVSPVTAGNWRLESDGIISNVGGGGGGPHRSTLQTALSDLT